MKIFHWPAIIIAISCAINAPAIADHKHGAGVVPCGEGCDKDTEFFDRQTDRKNNAFPKAV